MCKSTNVTEDQVKLRLFVFSLIGRTKDCMSHKITLAWFFFEIVWFFFVETGLQWLIVLKLNMQTAKKIILIPTPTIHVVNTTKISSGEIIKSWIPIKEFNKLLKPYPRKLHRSRKLYPTSWKLPKQVSIKLGKVKRKRIKLKGRWQRVKIPWEKIPKLQ